MRRLGIVGFAFMLLAAQQAAANMLANPSFEDQITSDGAPFVGFWEGFSGGAGAEAINGTVMPRTGTLHLSLSIFNTDNSFAGAFQDVPGITSGTQYTFSGWHKTPSNPLDLGVEIRIEWRDSVGNSEISRTPNFTPIPTADYTDFHLTAVAPAGADTARVVYAIQTFGAEPTNNGTVYVDDVSFVIPEPATASLICVAAAAALALRRRQF